MMSFLAISLGPNHTLSPLPNPLPRSMRTCPPLHGAVRRIDANHRVRIGHRELETRVERRRKHREWVTYRRRRRSRGVARAAALGSSIPRTPRSFRGLEDPRDPERHSCTHASFRHSMCAYSLRVPVVNFHDRLVIVPLMTALMSTRYVLSAASAACGTSAISSATKPCAGSCPLCASA